MSIRHTAVVVTLTAPVLCGGCITEYGFKYLGDAIPGDTASAVDPDRPDPTDSAFMDKCDISLLRVDAIPVDPPAPPSFSCVFRWLGIEAARFVDSVGSAITSYRQPASPHCRAY